MLALFALSHPRGFVQQWILALAAAVSLAVPLASAQQTEDETLAGQLLQAGLNHANQGQWAASEEQLTRCLAVLQRVYPADRFPAGHLDQVVAHTLLAHAQEQQGKLVPALRGYAAAVKMLHGLYPAEQHAKGHPQLAQGLSTLAFFLSNHGMPQQSREHYEKSLAMYAAAYRQEQSPDWLAAYASACGNYGGALWALGEADKALPHMELAVLLDEELYPPAKYPQGHPRLAVGLENLAVIQEALHDFPAALATNRKVLAIRERAYPRDKFPSGHEKLARSHLSLAILLRKSGQLEQAAAERATALSAIERLHPAGHLITVQALNEQGLAAAEAGDAAAAIVALQKAIAVGERAFGDKADLDQQRAITVTLANLGSVLKNEGRYTEALQTLLKHQAAVERLYPAANYPQGHADLAHAQTSLANLRHSMGDFAAAREHHEQALAMLRRLFPPERFPRGHELLETELSSYGVFLNVTGDSAGALALHKEALAMVDRLWPEPNHPKRLRKLGGTLDNYGAALLAQRDFRGAERATRQSLAAYEQLYSKADFPNGHPDIALTLSNLGKCLSDVGDFARARACSVRAIEMYKASYPPDKFPQGHPDWASALSNLGLKLHEQGERVEGKQYLQQALAMRQRLFPDSLYPNGHPELAISLVNLATANINGANSTELSQAIAHLRQALAMKEKLYAPELFPRGHESTVNSLINLADALLAAGETREAGVHAERAVDMQRGLAAGNLASLGLASAVTKLGQVRSRLGDRDGKLALYREALEISQQCYPESAFPLGNRALVTALNNLGMTLLERGEGEEGRALLAKATAMEERLAEAILQSASETQGVFYAEYHLGAPDHLLSVWPADADLETLYGHVWRRRGAVAREMAARKLAVTAGDPQARKVFDQYLQVRRQFALAATSGDAGSALRRERLAALARQKEDLERQLGEAATRTPAADASPARLAAALPATDAYLEIVQYTRFDLSRAAAAPDPKDRNQLEYDAFILARGQPLKRVRLGGAREIDRLVDVWLKAIEAGDDEQAARELSARLWQPLAAELPAGTQTIWLCPDGWLALLPWPALWTSPRERLVEKYTLALVPHGPQLLAQLEAADQRAPAPDAKASAGLIVGGVDYGQQPAATTGSGQRRIWPGLPGSSREIQDVSQAAGGQPVVLEGTAAEAARVVEELPKAAWAHLATHGYSHKGDRPAESRRNPLLDTGLVLAGANRPPAVDSLGIPLREPGLLTAETIAALPLERLRLVVLSACETGVGTQAPGEGVFSLPRAFHQAGAQCVVASLWQIDDDATAALMKLFYHYHWNDQKPPAEALRQAQLTLLRRPELTQALARTRGLGSVPVELSKQPAARDAKVLTRNWAAFVVWGHGR